MSDQDIKPSRRIHSFCRCNFKLVELNDSSYKYLVFLYSGFYLPFLIIKSRSTPDLQWHGNIFVIHLIVLIDT